MSGALRYASHTGSNHVRYTMLRDTLAMIAEKPLLGWGYGGFEYSFHHFRINQTPPTVVTEIARHPHNELLLWWVEGGRGRTAGYAALGAGGHQTAGPRPLA
ncbi:O-antigen ligase family protein [Serratia proteamaculans]